MKTTNREGDMSPSLGSAQPDLELVLMTLLFKCVLGAPDPASPGTC